MKILIVTSEWPTSVFRHAVPFLVQQVEKLVASGLEIEVFSFRGRANPLRYLAAWRRLRSTVDLTSFDLVHAHFGQSGVVALPCPVPLVVTFHGSDLQGLPGRNGRATLRGLMLTTLSRFVARCATRSIVVSEHLKSMIPEGALAAVIPCGIDLEVFFPTSMAAARDDLGLPHDQKLVLFTGNPGNPIKRFELAENAVSCVGGEFHARLIVLTGKPHSDVPKYLNACDALLLTSTHEGSPTIVKEALACNLPVVSLPVGDVVHRIAGLEGCEVVSEADPKALSAALDRVLRRGTRCEGGRNSVRDLDNDVVTPRLVDLYREVVG